MNPLTLTRLTANIGLCLALVLAAGSWLAGFGMNTIWIWAMALLAFAGAAAQFAVSIAKPGTIRPAWDEQVVASHRASYQFGYWVVLASFVVLFVLVENGRLGAETSFLILGPVLIGAPSVWMVGATLAGRAG